MTDPLLRSNHSATELLASATIPENLKKSVVSDAAQVEDPQRSLRPRLWSWGSRRFRVAVMLALALSIEGFMRSNINMAMICMVNKTASGVAESKTRVALDSGCIIDKSESKKMNPFILQHADIAMPRHEQAYVLTSFYLGGLFMVLPGGYLCDRFGPKNLVFYGAIINVIGTAISPMAVRMYGTWPLIVIRLLMGAGQVVLVPCMNVLVARWFPLKEKATAIAITTTGNQVSVIVALWLTAYLCQWELLGGWPSAFYVYAFMGIFLLAAWLKDVADHPRSMASCPETEIKYIEEDGHMAKHKSDLKTPWNKILTSFSVWAIAMSSFSQNFMNVGIIVYIPLYYENVLGMKLSRNGFMSAVPFIVQLLTKILFTWAAGKILAKKWMSLNGVTKFFNSLASFGAGICYILMVFCDCNSANMAVFLATAAVGLSSGFIPGYNTSVVCVAPRYTSTVASFSRFFAQIASVAAPYLIGLVVTGGGKAEWALAFYIMAGVLISTGIVFQLGGTADVEEWARPKPTPNPIEAEAQKPLTLSAAS